MLRHFSASRSYKKLALPFPSPGNYEMRRLISKNAYLDKPVFFIASGYFFLLVVVIRKPFFRTGSPWTWFLKNRTIFNWLRGPLRESRPTFTVFSPLTSLEIFAPTLPILIFFDHRVFYKSRTVSIKNIDKKYSDASWTDFWLNQTANIPNGLDVLKFYGPKLNLNWINFP